MNAVAARIMLLWGWQRAILAGLAGGVSALALPPVSFPLILFLTFPVLVWLLDGAVDSNEKGRVRLYWPAFATGWWFGFGYFLAGLYWIGQAFLVDSDVFGWMMPFAVVAMPAGLALFFAVGTTLARIFWSETAWRVLALAFGLGAAEWLRGHILTGFPWNLIGYAATVHDWPMQAASLIGIYGLTFVTIAVAAAPATLADENRSSFPMILAGLTLVGLVGYGAWRLESSGDVALTETRLRLVQPNIAQDQKWRPENRAAIFADFLAQTRGEPPNALRDVTAAIWPEAAVPFFLAQEPGALGSIADLLPVGRYLITGSNGAERDATSDEIYYTNSAYLIDDAGTIAARYDKNRLVPFGEMLPLERLLNQLGIRRLVTLPGTFVPGRNADLLDVPGLPPVRVLICYEVIFSNAVISRDDRPAWLLNLTNDAWFGDTAGPRQHFHQARVRAAEEGLPLVRVANTGISALIDPYGRIVERIPLNTRGVVDVDLPEAIEPPPASRYGLVVFFGALGLCFTGAMIGKTRQKV